MALSCLICCSSMSLALLGGTCWCEVPGEALQRRLLGSKTARAAMAMRMRVLSRPRPPVEGPFISSSVQENDLIVPPTQQPGRADVMKQRAGSDWNTHWTAFYYNGVLR